MTYKLIIVAGFKPLNIRDQYYYWCGLVSNVIVNMTPSKSISQIAQSEGYPFNAIDGSLRDHPVFLCIEGAEVFVNTARFSSKRHERLISIPFKFARGKSAKRKKA